MKLKCDVCGEGDKAEVAFKPLSATLRMLAARVWTLVAHWVVARSERTRCSDDSGMRLPRLQTLEELTFFQTDPLPAPSYRGFPAAAAPLSSCKGVTSLSFDG